MLKKYLDEKSVKYEEKLVDQDDAAKQEMMKESGGFLGVPFSVISKDGGAKETVVGFDKNKINSILKINK